MAIDIEAFHFNSLTDCQQTDIRTDRQTGPNTGLSVDISYSPDDKFTAREFLLNYLGGLKMCKGALEILPPPTSLRSALLPTN